MLITTAACSWQYLKPSQSPKTESYNVKAAYFYSLGVLLVRDGDYDEAIMAMEKALTFDEGSPYLSSELASLYQLKGDTDKALAICKKALLANPNDLDIHLLLGGLYIQTKDYPNAINT